MCTIVGRSGGAGAPLLSLVALGVLLALVALGVLALGVLLLLVPLGVLLLVALRHDAVGLALRRRLPHERAGAREDLACAPLLVGPLSRP